MATSQFINTQIDKGVWCAELTGAAQEAPDLQVTYLGQPVAGLTCVYDPSHNVWRVQLPIPSDLISDGVQTFVVKDAAGVTLNHFSLIVGDPLADDIRAEIALLRGELETLKKAFRRHCAEN